MSPRPLQSLGIPDTEHGRELKSLIKEMAALNLNYAPDDICISVMKDIQRALGPVDPALSEKMIDRHIGLLVLRTRSRFKQMRAESAQAEYGPLWEKGSRGCPEKDFEKVLRTVLKCAEEALTHKADRIPLEHRGPETRKDQNTILPGHIIIDPAKLSDTFVRKLGLSDMLAPKGSSQEEKLAAKDKIAPEIKKVLQHLEPMPVSPGYTEDYNFRHFRITEGPAKGYILKTQATHGSDVLSITTLPAAQRRIVHIAGKHRREQPVLVEMQTALSSMLTQLRDNWDELKSPETLNESLSTLDAMVGKLEASDDDYKRKLHARITHAMACLAKRNRGATITCIRDTDIIIGSRLKDIKGITQALSGDGSMLRNHVTAHSSAVESLYLKVTTQKGTIRLADPGEKIPDSEMGDLIAKLKNWAAYCENRVTFQPYLAFVEKIDKYLQEAASLFRVNPPDRKHIAEVFMRAFAVSKLAHFNNELQSIYDDISLHGEHGLRVEVLAKKLVAARHELHRRSIASNVHTTEFNPLWKRTRGLAAELTRELEAWENYRSEAERKAAAEKIKQLIKRFDLAGRLNAVPVLQ